jgi:hypothetical protein
MADRWKDYAEDRKKNSGGFVGENPEYKEDPHLKAHHAAARRMAKARAEQPQPQELKAQPAKKARKSQRKPGATPASPQQSAKE